MTVHVGTTPVRAVHVGTTPVRSIYVGTERVFSSALEAPTITSARQSGTSLTVTWEPVSGASGYQADYDQWLHSAWEDVSADVDVTATTWTTVVTRDRQHRVRVRAVDSAGAGPWSPWLEVDHPGLAVPPAPSGLTLAASHQRLRAAWTAEPTATRYTLRWRVRGGAWTVVAVDGSEHSADLAGLDNDATHDAQVRGGNAAGEGVWSATASESPAPQVLARPRITTVADHLDRTGFAWQTTTSWDDVPHAETYEARWRRRRAGEEDWGRWLTRAQTSPLVLPWGSGVTQVEVEVRAVADGWTTSGWSDTTRSDEP